MLLLTAEKYVIDSANNFSCPQFKYKALSRTDNPEYINISVDITMAPTSTDSPQLLTANHRTIFFRDNNDVMAEKRT